jgi:hypothetical protein
MAVLVEFTTEPILSVTASGELCPTAISEIKRLSRKLGMAKNSRNQAVEIEKSGDGTFLHRSLPDCSNRWSYLLMAEILSGQPCQFYFMGDSDLIRLLKFDSLDSTVDCEIRDE